MENAKNCKVNRNKIRFITSYIFIFLNLSEDLVEADLDTFFAAYTTLMILNSEMFMPK